MAKSQNAADHSSLPSAQKRRQRKAKAKSSRQSTLQQEKGKCERNVIHNRTADRTRSHTKRFPTDPSPGVLKKSQQKNTKPTMQETLVAKNSNTSLRVLPSDPWAWRKTVASTNKISPDPSATASSMLVLPNRRANTAANTSSVRSRSTSTSTGSKFLPRGSLRAACKSSRQNVLDTRIASCSLDSAVRFCGRLHADFFSY